MAKQGLESIIKSLDKNKSKALINIVTKTLPDSVDLNKPDSLKKLKEKDIKKIVDALSKVTKVSDKEESTKKSATKKASDKGKSPEAAKKIFEAYRKKHPSTTKKWQDFYEKGSSKNNSSVSDEDVAGGMSAVKNIPPATLKKTDLALQKDLEDSFRDSPEMFADKADQNTVISSGIATVMGVSGFLLSLTSTTTKGVGAGLALGVGTVAVLGIASMSHGKKTRAANKVFNEEMNKPEKERDNALLMRMYKTGLVDNNKKMDDLIDSENEN